MRTAIIISSLTAIRMTVKNSVWWMLKGDIDTAHLRRDGQPDNQSLLFGWVGRGSRQDLFYIRFSGKRGAGSNQRSRNTSIRQTRLSYMRALSVLVAGEGLEPPTFGLWAQRAANCSTPRYYGTKITKKNKSAKNIGFIWRVPKGCCAQ